MRTLEAEEQLGSKMGTELFERVTRTRIDLFKADIQLCLTFLDLADTEHKIGDERGAAQAVEHAKKGYLALRRLFSSRLHTKQFTKLEIAEIGAGLGRLRQELERHKLPRTLNASLRKSRN